MAQFNGTYVQNFDSKGRVSVPASFRAALREGSDTATRLAAAGDGPTGVPLVLRPSEKTPCIEGWTEDRFRALTTQLDGIDPMSAEYDIVSMAIYGDAYTLEADREGRIVIPDFLMSGVGLSRAGGVAFVGLGTRFQMWEPGAVAARKAETLAAYRARAEQVRAGKPGGAAP